MLPKLLIIAGLALVISAPAARAQEWQWAGWGHLQALRIACEDGDWRACQRLRHARAWREHRRFYDEDSDWRWRRHHFDEEDRY